MTTIALTGAGGFAGHHCLEHLLLNTSWDIVCIDSFRHHGKTDRIAEVLSRNPAWCRRVRVITHDLAAPFSQQTFMRMVAQRGIDYVIAYASDSHVDRAISDPVPFVTNNTGIALTTLELCRQLKPKALVWVSTDEVYGPQADGEPPFSEWAPILPSNPYAASKAAQEALCISYWRTYGVPVIIVNCMNMIGERQDCEKFVPKVIRAARDGAEIGIHGSPGSCGTRHYLHSRNLADGIMYLLTQTAPARYPEDSRPSRYNIASADRIDNFSLAKMIAGFTGKDLKYRWEDFHSTRPGHDLHYGLNPAKINALGWEPPVPLYDSLKRTVEWSLDHPEWLEE